MFEEEQAFLCPYCGQVISMNLDPSAGAQSYIEDCEVCCRPIEVSYTVEQGAIRNVTAVRLDD